MKYVEKHFTLRIHRRDGTSKLLLGVTGHPPKIGSLKQIKLAQDEVLTIKVVDLPRRDEPAEAIEVWLIVGSTAVDRGADRRRYVVKDATVHSFASL